MQSNFIFKVLWGKYFLSLIGAGFFFSALVIITYFKLANRLKVSGVENVPRRGG